MSAPNASSLWPRGLGGLKSGENWLKFRKCESGLARVAQNFRGTDSAPNLLQSKLTQDSFQSVAKV
jgi:hypothetical protein